jgi:hypothetical protein
VNLLTSAFKAALLAAVLACLDVEGVHRLLLAAPGTVDAGLTSELSRFALAGVLDMLWVAVTYLDRLRRHQAELDCDRFSAELTGDPLAMSVALLTIESLTDARRDQKGTTHPSTAQRLRLLGQILSREGPRAPWALRKVPAAIQASNAGGALTVRLDRAPPPPPLPLPSLAIAAWPAVWPPVETHIVAVPTPANSAATPAAMPDAAEEPVP